MEETNEASATSSIMNLSQTLRVIDDAKAPCSIPYSYGNIKLKSLWGPVDHPSVSLSW